MFSNRILKGHQIQRKRCKRKKLWKIIGGSFCFTQGHGRGFGSYTSYSNPNHPREVNGHLQQPTMVASFQMGPRVAYSSHSSMESRMVESKMVKSKLESKMVESKMVDLKVENSKRLATKNCTNPPLCIKDKVLEEEILGIDQLLFIKDCKEDCLGGCNMPPPCCGSHKTWVINHLGFIPLP
jgi:hypothetical protein